MNEKRIELAERRAALVASAAAQRQELAQVLVPWRRPIELLEQGAAAVRSHKKHPEAMAGLAILLGILRRWRFLRWLPSGWAVWRFARVALRAKNILDGF